MLFEHEQKFAYPYKYFNEELKCRYQIIIYVWGSKIYITTGFNKRGFYAATRE